MFSAVPATLNQKRSIRDTCPARPRFGATALLLTKNRGQHESSRFSGHDAMRQSLPFVRHILPALQGSTCLVRLIYNGRKARVSRLLFCSSPPFAEELYTEGIQRDVCCIPLAEGEGGGYAHAIRVLQPPLQCHLGRLGVLPPSQFEPVSSAGKHSPSTYGPSSLTRLPS